MTYPESDGNRTTKCQHIVQLFDSPESVADTVALYVKEGLDEGASVILVMTAGHWSLAAGHLEQRHIDPRAAIADGRLTVRDSLVTLGRFMRGGSPQPNLFIETVGAAVRQAQKRSPDVRIYGDMVDRLTALGDFHAAFDVEQLWNALQAEHRFTLLCGYSAVHFGHPRSNAPLRRICDCHSDVRTSPEDMLGAFLLSHRTAESASAGDIASTL